MTYSASLALTSVIGDIDERELGVFAHWHGERQRTIFALPDGLLKVAHKVAGQVERSRDTNLLDILLNIGLRLEMGHVRKSAVGLLADMQKCREYQVLDTELLRCICNILALAKLDIILGALPVVGHEENSIGSFKGLSY